MLAFFPNCRLHYRLNKNVSVQLLYPFALDMISESTAFSVCNCFKLRNTEKLVP
jgi:hypothetical protein